jgi:hypothetical protein
MYMPSLAGLIQIGEVHVPATIDRGPFRKAEARGQRDELTVSTDEAEGIVDICSRRRARLEDAR